LSKHRSKNKAKNKGKQEVQLVGTGQTCAVYGPKSLLGRATDLTHDLRRYGYTMVNRAARGTEEDPDTAVVILEESFLASPTKSRIMIQLYGLLYSKSKTRILMVLVYNDRQQVRVPKPAELLNYCLPVTEEDWSQFAHKPIVAPATATPPEVGLKCIEQEVVQ